MAHPYPSEKKLLEELLLMYRETTVCLWNPSHPGYTNKVSRRRASETLLVKFRELDPTADAYKMKKRIENMRTTYKRERLKVLRSRGPGGGEALYQPTLWYYPLMRFLDVLDPARDPDPDPDPDHDDADEDNDSSHYSLSESDPLPPTNTKRSTVYITNEAHDYEPSPAKVPRLKYSSDEEEPPYLIKKEPSYVIHSPEAPPHGPWAGPAGAGDLFGRAMTTRLHELLPQQRYIAEKLISDVIFLGRLNKLKTGSTINVNDDSY